jgi:hypothetical protein
VDTDRSINRRIATLFRIHLARLLRNFDPFAARIPHVTHGHQRQSSPYHLNYSAASPGGSYQEGHPCKEEHSDCPNNNAFDNVHCAPPNIIDQSVVEVSDLPVLCLSQQYKGSNCLDVWNLIASWDNQSACDVNTQRLTPGLRKFAPTIGRRR